MMRVIILSILVLTIPVGTFAELTLTVVGEDGVTPVEQIFCTPGGDGDVSEHR